MCQNPSKHFKKLDCFNAFIEVFNFGLGPYENQIAEMVLIKSLFYTKGPIFPILYISQDMKVCASCHKMKKYRKIHHHLVAQSYHKNHTHFCR